MREQPLPREFLYLADEAFFCGTAVEITPIRSIDKITVGNGRRGPVTAALQERFFGIIKGDLPDEHNWLTPVRSRRCAVTDGQVRMVSDVFVKLGSLARGTAWTPA